MPPAGMTRIRISGACLVAALVISATAAVPASQAATGLMAWGSNSWGELGNGSTTRSTIPVAVNELARGVNAISAGSTHSLALLGNATVKAWGANEYGQLGDGTSTGPSTCPSFGEPCSTAPVAVSGLAGATAISAGGAHNLALLSDGTVMAWGSNGAGQLGNGNNTGPSTCGRFPFTEACSTTPIPVSGLGAVAAVSAGSQDSLALLSNGTVMAWGNNESGQLGNETTTNSAKPVAVSGLSGVTAISAGDEHNLALLSSGTVMAWVLNGNGQLGDGTVVKKTAPVAVTGLSGVRAIAAGLAHSLALLSNATVMAWGWNNEGQLGDGAIGEAQPTPVAVTGLSGATLASAGGYYSMAYSPPAPTVAGVSPGSGPQPGGTSVNISGTEFTGATAVKFGAAGASSFKVNSGTSITAISPRGTGTVDVTVTNPGATSATSPGDRFSYVPAAASGEYGQCRALGKNTVPKAKHGRYADAACKRPSSGWESRRPRVTSNGSRGPLRAV